MWFTDSCLLGKSGRMALIANLFVLQKVCQDEGSRVGMHEHNQLLLKGSFIRSNCWSVERLAVDVQARHCGVRQLVPYHIVRDCRHQALCLASMNRLSF